MVITEKIICIILVLSFILCALAGCGETGSNNPGENGTPSGSSIEDKSSERDEENPASAAQSTTGKDGSVSGKEQPDVKNEERTSSAESGKDTAETETTEVFSTYKSGAVPPEKATKGRREYTLSNLEGEVVSEDPESGQMVFRTTETDVVVEYQSYYIYKDNYASIESIRINDSEPMGNARCYVNLNVIKIKNRSSNMRLEYRAYDSSGNVVRHSYMMAKLDGVKNGDTVNNVRFDIPYDSVRVEITNVSQV